MGKVIFTPIQELIFNQFAKNKNLYSKFYFTGGTTLSAFYLNHRESNDLDFFCSQNFTNEAILPFIKEVGAKLTLPSRFTQQEETRIFEFVKNGTLIIKVDFAYYPYKRIKKGIIYKNVSIDSLIDIATNKLLSITQRTDIKDFVDLYFLFKKFTLWDLLYAVEAKFKIKLDLILLASDFLKVEEFNFLPKMLVSLKIKDLQEFFKKQSSNIGRKVTKK